MINKIDAVISWVDGNDENYIQKLNSYLPENQQRNDDINGKTRFANVGEIYFCIASILRFAPFVRKIFIVSDNQKPKKLNHFIAKNFPENKIPIEFINHQTIFRGYENVLPVFNSLSIETCLWRIPDLSENFVYFNDDVFLVRPIEPKDWFIDDRITAVGSWRNIFIDKFISKIKPHKNGHKPFGYKDSLMNSADTLNVNGKYFYVEHTPMPMKKSVFEIFFTKNKNILFNNINHKFRCHTQFNLQEFSCLSMFSAGKLNIRKSNCFLYINHVKRGSKYIDCKIQKYDSNPQICYCCIGSLDKATENDRKIVFDWLKKILNIEI